MVRRTRLAIGLRFHRRMLWRPRRSHLCRGNWALIRSADELAAVDARPLPAGLQFGRAIPREAGQGYVGTVEFFPEEGKYHLDGHRKCAVKLSPRETLAQGGRCPVCGAALTIGVAHRVEALADRSESQIVPPPTAG